MIEISISFGDIFFMTKLKQPRVCGVQCLISIDVYDHILSLDTPIRSLYKIGQ